MIERFFFNSIVFIMAWSPLIIGIVLAIITIISINQKVKDKQSSKGKKFNYESDFKYCILVFLAEIMKADEKTMVCELDSVKSTIHRYYKTEGEQAAALKLFQSILNKNNIILDEIFNRINQGFDYAAKSEIIMELLAVAYADNYLRSVEETKMQFIVENLEYIARAIQKHQSHFQGEERWRMLRRRDLQIHWVQRKHIQQPLRPKMV